MKKSHRELMESRLECFKWVGMVGYNLRRTGPEFYSQRQMRIAMIYSRLSPLDFYHDPTEMCFSEKVTRMIREMPREIPIFMPRLLSADLFAHYIYAYLLPYFYAHKGDEIRYEDIVDWIYKKRGQDKT